MNDPKTRINIEPDIIAYSNYIDWMMDNYHPRLILKICADLAYHHIELYNRNPMTFEFIRRKMIIIKEYAYTGQGTFGQLNNCYILRHIYF